MASTVKTVKFDLLARLTGHGEQGKCNPEILALEKDAALRKSQKATETLCWWLHLGAHVEPTTG